MHGFKKKGKKIIFKSINIKDLAKYAKDKTEINLADFGFNKLLGQGKTNKPYKITVDYASAKAIAKIEEAKGKVTVLKVAEAKENTPEGQSEKSDDAGENTAEITK